MPSEEHPYKTIIVDTANGKLPYAVDDKTKKATGYRYETRSRSILVRILRSFPRRQKPDEYGFDEILDVRVDGRRRRCLLVAVSERFARRY